MLHKVHYHKRFFENITNDENLSSEFEIMANLNAVLIQLDDLIPEIDVYISAVYDSVDVRIVHCRDTVKHAKDAVIIRRFLEGYGSRTLEHSFRSNADFLLLCDKDITIYHHIIGGYIEQTAQHYN
jgi:hypothetical protein